MKVLKENLNLFEDLHTEYEPGTYFKQIMDKEGRPYPKPTVYKVIDTLPDGNAWCDVVGHWASNKFEVSYAYLQRATELGYFVILGEEERNKVIAEEEKRIAQKRAMQRAKDTGEKL